MEFDIFFNNWIKTQDKHVVEYVNKLPNISYDSIKKEISYIGTRMACGEKYGIEFQYNWSVKGYLEDCIRHFDKKIRDDGLSV